MQWDLFDDATCFVHILNRSDVISYVHHTNFRQNTNVVQLASDLRRICLLIKIAR